MRPNALDTYQESYYELRLKLKFIDLTGIGFQDFFSDIMEAAFGTQFYRIKPSGSAGDRKCDGLLRDQGRIFSVYAPEKMKEKETIGKIDEDFEGAVKHWKDMFSTWVFMHNALRGLNPDVAKHLIEMKSNPYGKEIEKWCLPEIRNIVFSLDPLIIERLMGPAPSRVSMTGIRMVEIKTVVESIAGASDLGEQRITPPPADKIKRNSLSKSVETLLTIGIAKEPLVADFFKKWKDPTLADNVSTAFRQKYDELKKEEQDPDVIFMRLQEFAGGATRRSPEIESAILSVLAYLFDRCDIYEPGEVINGNIAYEASG